MEAFSALLAICAGNSPVTGDFREAGDLKHYCAHYDVTVMFSCFYPAVCHYISMDIKDMAFGSGWNDQPIFQL